MSASTWGDPNATKHVLLIHGLISSSHSWHRIAPELASRGYYVIAPDLLGHGRARRGSDYTLAALVNEFRPYLSTTDGNDHPYEIVIGQSLGGVIAAALLPLLKSTRPVHVVLGDPPLELASEAIVGHKPQFRDRAANPRAPEVHQQEWPFYTQEDAFFAYVSESLCDPAAVDAILDQNIPWSFSHLLSTVPDNVKVTVLAADPSKGGYMKEEYVKPYPRVACKTISGATHRIPMQLPQVVIETALQGTTA